MRILLFIATIVFLAVCYWQSGKSDKIAPLPQQKIQAVDSTFDTLSPNADTLPAPKTDWEFDSLAVHQMVERILKTCKDSIPVDLAAVFLKLVDSTTQEYPHVWHEYHNSGTPNNYLQSINLDNDPEKELIIHLEDFSAWVYVFNKKRDGIWQIAGKLSYLPMLYMGIQGEAGVFKSFPKQQLLSLSENGGFNYANVDYCSETKLYKLHQDTLSEVLLALSCTNIDNTTRCDLFYETNFNLQVLEKDKITIDYKYAIQSDLLCSEDFNGRIMLIEDKKSIEFNYNPNKNRFIPITKNKADAQLLGFLQLDNQFIATDSCIANVFKKELLALEKNGNHNQQRIIGKMKEKWGLKNNQ